MCKCTPEIRTPFCGKIGCKWPPQEEKKIDPIITDLEKLKREAVPLPGKNIKNAVLINFNNQK